MNRDFPFATGCISFVLSMVICYSLVFYQEVNHTASDWSLSRDRKYRYATYKITEGTADFGDVALVNYIQDENREKRETIFRFFCVLSVSVAAGAVTIAQRRKH